MGSWNHMGHTGKNIIKDFIYKANVCLFTKQCVFWWWGQLQFKPCVVIYLCSNILNTLLMLNQYWVDEPTKINSLAPGIMAFFWTSRSMWLVVTQAVPWDINLVYWKVTWLLTVTALAITPSHHQNTQDFADGCKNMNGICNNYVCRGSHIHLGRHFQNV